MARPLCYALERMDQHPTDQPLAPDPHAGRLALALMGGGTLALLAAGLVLWWREGDALFAQGLVAAILSCF